jgi:hypothetical protein
MKPTVLIVATAFVLASCQKERSFETSTASPGGGSNTYFIEAKVNGTLHTFDVNAVAKMTDFGSGLKSLSITGSASATATDLEDINLSINFLNVTPTIGTYSENDSTSKYVAAGIYNPNSATTVYTAGVATNSSLPLSITITKLDSTQVEGTFKGAFYKTDITSGAPTSDYITLTEGSFRLAIQ